MGRDGSDVSLEEATRKLKWIRYTLLGSGLLLLTLSLNPFGVLHRVPSGIFDILILLLLAGAGLAWMFQRKYARTVYELAEEGVNSSGEAG